MSIKLIYGDFIIQVSEHIINIQIENTVSCSTQSSRILYTIEMERVVEKPIANNVRVNKS